MKKIIKVFTKEINIKYTNLFEYTYDACDISEILKILNYIGLDNFEVKSTLYKGSSSHIRKNGLKIIFHYNFRDRKEFRNKYYKFLSHPDVLKYFYVR